MESAVCQAESSAYPSPIEPHGSEVENSSSAKISVTGNLQSEDDHHRSTVQIDCLPKTCDDLNNNAVKDTENVRCIADMEVSSESSNKSEQITCIQAPETAECEQVHVMNAEKPSKIPETCESSSRPIMSEHSYSRSQCNSMLESGDDTCLKIYDTPLKFGEHEDQIVYGLPEQDFSIGDPGQSFVSSLVEVIDSVEENRDVVCIDSGSTDETTSNSDSDTSDSSSDSTSSDSSFERMRTRDIELAEEIAALKNPVPLKVQGELLSKDLPPVEDLNIKLSEEVVLRPVGKVSQIVSDNTVIIKSLPNKPALDCDTVLFFTKELAIGRVEETFGPVPCPYYVVRFNSKEHVCAKGVELEREVFYAPSVTDFTSFVFVSALKQLRGSDASWINDIEPPPSCLDYSDDEQEREARKQRKNNNNPRRQQGEANGPQTGGRGRGRGRRRNNWHNRSAVRVNTADAFMECQNGWQSAVESRSRNLNQEGGMAGSVGQEASLVNPFRVPPPPPPQFTGYHGDRNPLPPGIGRVPNWPPPPFPAFPMFNIPPPPPPPPPAPPL